MCYEIEILSLHNAYEVFYRDLFIIFIMRC